MKSLAWELGGATGTVALTPGNQFWTHELDLSTEKAGAVQVTYTLENLTGNRQAARLKLKVDPEADRPILTVASPAKGARVAAARVAHRARAPTTTAWTASSTPWTGPRRIRRGVRGFLDPASRSRRPGRTRSC